MEISLQRTVIARSTSRGPPPSYGRAPLATADSQVVAGVGANKGFWIGFQPLSGATQVALRVKAEAPVDLDAVTGSVWTAALSSAPRNYVIVPAQRALTGIRKENVGVTQQFLAHETANDVANCQRLRVELVAVKHDPVPTAEVSVEHFSWTRIADVNVLIDILTASEFADLTGLGVPPLVESERYQRRRLP